MSRFLMVFFVLALPMTCFAAAIDEEEDDAFYSETPYFPSYDRWERAEIVRGEDGVYRLVDNAADLKATTQTKKEWKCPYCFHWWPMGERCGNSDCPTTQW